MRARDFARGLSELGFDVDVLCVDNDSPSDHPERAGAPSGVNHQGFRSTLGDRAAGALGWLRGGPLQSAPFVCRELEHAAARRLAELGPGDVVVVQLARQLRLLERVVDTLEPRTAAQRPRVVVDLIDTLSLNFAQRADLDAWWKAPLWRGEAQRLRRAELRVTELADAVTLVCERDLQALAQFAPLARQKGAVLRLPVPAASDAGEAASDLGGGRFPKVALTGNLGYFVNHLAAERFVHDVWPLIKQELPEARLTVAGARPRRSLSRSLSSAGESLVADPADLRGLLRSATVAVAPLSGGAGVPVKVLEAWAERVPVVASAWAAAGVAGSLGAERPEGGGETPLPLVAVPDDATPAQWASAVLALLADTERRARLADHGAERLASLHSVEAFRSELERLLALA